MTQILMNVIVDKYSDGVYPLDNQVIERRDSIEKGEEAAIVGSEVGGRVGDGRRIGDVV